MESIIQKINFSKNENCIFLFFKFDYMLLDGCFHKNFEIHVSRSFSKQKKLLFKETETFIF